MISPVAQRRAHGWAGFLSPALSGRAARFGAARRTRMVELSRREEALALGVVTVVVVVMYATIGVAALRLWPSE